MRSCLDIRREEDKDKITPEVSEPITKQKGGETMSCVRPGDRAPEFKAMALVGTEFKEISLSDYRGKWVVLCFYPADFTFVCPTELAAIAAKYDELKKLNTEAIAVSTDTHFVHKIWQEYELTKLVEGGIPFPLVADPTAKIGKAYGVYDEAEGVHIRGRFIIDPDGVIQAMEILSPPVGRNVSELIRQLQAYQHVRETGGKEVCPAGWKPGKTTLKPGPDLVGNVWKVWKVEEAFK